MRRSFAPAASGSTSRWSTSTTSAARSPGQSEAASIELGLAIATTVEQLWAVVDPSEGVRWFERLFDQPQDRRPGQLARAGAPRVRERAAHLGPARSRRAAAGSRASRIFDRLGDEHNRAVMLHRLGLSAMLLRGRSRPGGEARPARATRSIAEARDTWGLAQTTGALGAIARDRGDERAALDLVAPERVSRTRGQT